MSVLFDILHIPTCFFCKCHPASFTCQTKWCPDKTKHILITNVILQSNREQQQSTKLLLFLMKYLNVYLDEVESQTSVYVFMKSDV